MNEPPAAGNRLLVVDDEPAHRKMLARALQEAGFEVEEAAGGLEAIAAANLRPPDLVLLDIDMPGIDGYETCRRLKEQERFASTPVIFLSGLGDIEGKMKAFAAGGVDYVTKPFFLEEVRVRVATHLEIERLRRAAELHLRELDANLARLHEVEHFRHDLVHMVAHDMRSPLMAVSGYLELLDLDGDRLGEDHRDYVAQALDGARSLVRLVDAMLDTDRLESGKLPLQLADRDLRAILDLALASLGPASVRRLVLETATPGRIVVHADSEVLRRVIANLVANALRNSEDDAKVRIVASTHGARARLEVHDTGSAIPDDFRPRVFEKYATRAGDRGPHRRAVGLGLPFCRLAVEAHGGTIGFDSGAGGSTFWIELPTPESAAAPA
ncbi:MAG: response regulator [Thermoanaerobaculia bacterium]|nr:response regulator [Thermoanaerobaculia bacterium]MBP9823996.1 response regulator [Thermoanaerobaculia bacterium]